ncbi:hypothetical protein EYF80_057258 [Liparis tanakae]|uniref:Uncharacterized protein n=1 Tax=Liparis tanakae TaxID=230148 RepID=A0A4Z2EUS8_9TELE|nr:hypothetical protein EYF80_057258 [Liparis tanakae]
MGSGTSRGKRAAARVSAVNGTSSPEQDRRPLKPLRIHARLRTARHRAQPDCHSEGHDSDVSREDDDVEAAEMETFVTGRGSAATRRPENTALRSQTYGLCQFTQEDDADPGSAPRSPAEGPRGSPGGPGDVNKRSGDAFTAACPSPRSSSSRGFLTRGAFLAAVPTSGKQSVTSSLAMPVLLGGWEEELMDTIEKEFS